MCLFGSWLASSHYCPLTLEGPFKKLLLQRNKRSSFLHSLAQWNPFLQFLRSVEHPIVPKKVRVNYIKLSQVVILHAELKVKMYKFLEVILQNVEPFDLTDYQFSTLSSSHISGYLIQFCNFIVFACLQVDRCITI